MTTNDSKTSLIFQNQKTSSSSFVHIFFSSISNLFFILPIALQALSVLNLVVPEPFLAINRVSAWHVQIAHRSLRQCSFGNV